MRKPINITNVRLDSNRLVSQLWHVDANGDGLVDEQESFNAWRQLGPRELKTFRDLWSALRSERRYDPGPVDVDALLHAVNQGVYQLQQIDTFSGGNGRPPNKPDGVVTKAELDNFDPPKGRLPKYARIVARYAHYY